MEVLADVMTDIVEGEVLKLQLRKGTKMMLEDW
jgi:hypothetical protein